MTGCTVSTSHCLWGELYQGFPRMGIQSVCVNDRGVSISGLSEKSLLKTSTYVFFCLVFFLLLVFFFFWSDSSQRRLISMHSSVQGNKYLDAEEPCGPPWIREYDEIYSMQALNSSRCENRKESHRRSKQ